MKTLPSRSFLLALALAAVALPSFAAEPVNIARLQTTTIKTYKANGTDLNGGGFGGDSPLKNMFDGNLSNGTCANGIGNKGYVVLDFGTSYFVESIDVTKQYRYKYSLFYTLSSSGEDWVQVPYASNVCRMGTKKWGVYAVASRVKIVFEEGGSFIHDVAEVEVWGVPASEMECNHAALSAWTEVPNSATCTKVGLEQAVCSTCGEVFTRESGGLPLGHDYRANVVSPGKGWFFCNRCSHLIDCSNGEVDLTSLGKMSFDETSVQFTDVSTAVLCLDESNGNRNDAFIDNNLTTQWIQTSAEGIKATFKFAAPIQLTKIEVTVEGSNYGIWYHRKITAVDGTDETTILPQDRYYLEGNVGTVTQTYEFSDKTVNEITVSVWNNGGWRAWIDEIRVYGTVPGAVNYIPALILMQ